MTRDASSNTTTATEVDDLIVTVAESSREELMAMLGAAPCPFPLDFTDTYLDSLTLDRLRHLVMAVCLQARKSARRQSEYAA